LSTAGQPGSTPTLPVDEQQSAGLNIAGVCQRPCGAAGIDLAV